MTTLATRQNGIEFDTLEAGEASEDRQYGITDFIATAAAANDSRNKGAYEKLRNVYKVRAALSPTSGTLGGYLIPSSLQIIIARAVAAKAIVRPRAMPVKMTTLKVDLPALADTTAQTAGVSPYHGGLTGSWIPTEGTWPVSEPAFRSVTLQACLLGLTFDISNGLLQSGTNVDAILTDAIASAVVFGEDVAFLRGNGVGEPLGVLNSAALITTAARAAASTLAFSDARLLSSRLPDSSRDTGNPVWIVSQAALDELEAAATETSSLFGRISSHVVAEIDPVTGVSHLREHRFLLGYELLVSSKLPALNVVGDFGLYDFSQYLVGDLQPLEIMISAHPDFRNNRSTVRLVHWVGGTPRLNAPITAEDASATLSPFVALGTA